MARTQARATRLTAVAAAGGAVDWLNRATLRLRFNRGEIDPRILCGRTTTGTYFDSAGVLQTAAIGVPRLTYDPANLAAGSWLLAEEARTNSIRNSTMQGAVAGTPGAVPNFWTIGNAHGLSGAVQSVGSVSGVPFIRVRVSGTATSVGPYQIAFEPVSQLAASSGQTWTKSVFLRVDDAPKAPNNYRIRVQAIDSSGNTLSNGDTLLNPTSVALQLQRFIGTATLTNTSTAFVRPTVVFGITAGVFYDFTVDVGLPQLELGASASSPIPTSGTAVTRSADNLSMTDMSWYSAAGGVLYTDSQSVAFTQRIAALTDGTANNSFQQYVNSTVAGMDAYVAGVFQGNGGASGVFQTNTRYKVASRIVANNAVTAINGAIGTTDTSYSLPTVDRLLLGQARTAQSSVGTLIREIAFIPNTSISDSALRRLTRL